MPSVAWTLDDNVTTVEKNTLEIQQLVDAAQFDLLASKDKAYHLFKQPHIEQCNNYVDLLNYVGFLKYLDNNLIEAKKQLFRAETLINENSISTSHVTNQMYLGLVYVLEQKNAHAIQYFERSKSISEQIPDKKGICQAYSNLGLAHLKDKNFKASETNLLQAIRLSEEIGHKETKGYSLQNLATVHLLSGNHDKAIIYIDEAINLWKSMNFDRGLSYAFVIKAGIYWEQKKYPEQIDILKRALELKNINLNKYLIHKELASTYDQTKNLDKAIYHYEQALENSYGYEIENADFNKIISKLVDIYIEENEADKISHLFNNFYTGFKANQEIEATRRISNANLLKEEINENKELTANNNTIQKKVEQQNLLLYALLFVLLSISVILGILYNAHKIRKKLLKKIQLQNDELSSINGQLEQSLNTIDNQNKQLSAKNDELDNFAFIASHDLKAPARTMQNFSKLLTRKLNDTIDDQSKELLSFIEVGSNNMCNMIESLLNFARMSKDSLVFKTINPKEIFDTILLEAKSNINEKKASIKIGQLPDNIVADHIKFKQIALNLINNGLKFTHKDDRPVIINIDYTSSDDYHNFHIKDNGIGIAPKHQEGIFKMFQKLNNNTEYEGTGIGLATCGKSAQLHKGKIWVESTPGEGSTFSFSISKGLEITSPTPNRQRENIQQEKALTSVQ